MHVPIYSGDERVAGRITVFVPDGKKMEHLGIKVELKGIIGKLPICVGLR